MIAWYVCVLVVSIAALGFYSLGALFKAKSAAETNQKLRQKLDKKRDDILRYLNTLGSLVNDRIVADKKLAEDHDNEKDVNLAYVYRGLSKQWKIMKDDLDALIWMVSIQ